MRQRGGYVATETAFVNPHAQEISVENIDCDNEARQGAAGCVLKASLAEKEGTPQRLWGSSGEECAEDLHGSSGG
jgi:hypothetical protein